MSVPDLYPLPRRYLYAPEWTLNFWDALYYLAARHQGRFEVTARDVARLMSGGDPARQEIARQYFVKLRQAAVANGELLDQTPEEGWNEEEIVLDDAWPPERRRTHRMGEKSFYLLAIPGYAGMQRGYILKPAGYVHHSWIGRIEPALPKQVLNFLLARPRRHHSGPTDPERLDARPIPAWVKEFVARRRGAGVHVHPQRVKAAFRKLGELGLLLPCERGYWLDADRLQRPIGETGNRPPEVDPPGPASRRWRSSLIRATFRHQSHFYQPFAFAEDPDAQRIVSATLRLSWQVRDWARYAFPAPAVDRRQVTVRLVDARRRPLDQAHAEWTWQVESAEEYGRRRYDLSALVRGLPALNGLGLEFQLDQACEWLRLTGWLEFVVV